MRIAVSGKGGVGKTTLAGTLARIFARNHRRVLALDVDSNPNLARSLGISGASSGAPSVPMGLTEWRTDETGHAYVHLNHPVSQFIANYGQPGPNGVTLMVMGEVEVASAGCRCEAHAVARGLTGHLAGEAEVVVLDMEAGLEHLGRGTTEHVDVLLIVVEPYFRALETATRIHELAVQLSLPRILVVGNRVRNAEEEEAVRQFCERHGLDLAAVIPFDEAVVMAEMSGVAPLDYAPDSPVVQAAAGLARKLEVLAN